MRLKNLEIKGFKSFADETVIHFNEAVTGIVGPNGSGKSNIVDAIRWVLGEQKGKELRLEAMADVIFNGTKKRKEAPMAKVSLTFENTRNLLPTEYPSVELSRILYRSGESEYRLNGVPCRLKDITSLFMDTGVGSDSYAIIALNMVEDMLANKENARRKMFEQAAGISKYKSRKRESLNKLKASKEDMARIDDLLFEINNNLVELEKQAKRTKKFVELKDKYKAAGLLLQYISVKSLKEKSKHFDVQLEEQVLKIHDQEAAYHLAEAELEQYKKSHIDQEKNLSDFQRKLNEVLDQIRQLESAIQIKEQSNILHRDQIKSLQGSIEQALLKLMSLKESAQEISLEVEKVTNSLDISSLNLSEQEIVFLQKQNEYEQLKSGADQFHLQRQDQEKEIFLLEKEIAIFNNKIENLHSDSSRSQEELNNKSLEYAGVVLQIQEDKMVLQNIQDEIKILQQTEEERKANHKGLQDEIENLVIEIAANNRSRDAKRNEFDLLHSMVEKLEGFPESIKFLHQNWRKDVPVLSDLIYSDEKYRSPIELYLEPYLNFYVVRNDQEAVQAVRLLFNNSKGKANFFVLNKFSSMTMDRKVIPGCRLAMDVIETDPLYAPLLNNLLHEVYILEQDQHLEDVMRFPDDIAVISLSGSIIKNKNTISGGSVGLFEGKKLGRKKNLEKLEKDIKDIDSDGLELDKQYATLKNELKIFELHTKEQEIESLKKKELFQIQHLTQLETRFQHFNDVKDQLESRIKSNEKEFNEINRFIELQSSELFNRKALNQDLVNTISHSDQIFDKVATELSGVSNIYNQAKLELLRWQNKLENIRKDFDFKSQQIEELNTQSELQGRQQGELEILMAENANKLAEFKVELLEKLGIRKSMEGNLSALEREYYEVRNTITEQENTVKLCQRNMQDLQSQVNTIKDQRSEFKFRIQSCYEKAQIEFNTHLDNYVPDSEMAEWEEDKIAERAQYYKVRMDNYGEVNPLALEAYEEMSERYEKIQVQREDILKAQDSLMETIKEIEATATSAFLDSFHQVRAHFQNVFRSLFTADDDCDLILVDTNDPLECDIDIIAKPKGKRPKSISQLSGGEKTLTAIALLFSLYLLKPAPFCVFDEVDAPLDDINIEKFNSIVRKFSKESQFVIITHNKLTMADVDVLYGVYMEDQGVSSVTSVDFRKYDHEVVLEQMAN